MATYNYFVSLSTSWYCFMVSKVTLSWRTHGPIGWRTRFGNLRAFIMEFYMLITYYAINVLSMYRIFKFLQINVFFIKLLVRTFLLGKLKVWNNLKAIFQINKLQIKVLTLFAIYQSYYAGLCPVVDWSNSITRCQSYCMGGISMPKSLALVLHCLAKNGRRQVQRALQ